MSFNKSYFNTIYDLITQEAKNASEWSNIIIKHLDLTSLKGDESADTINQLCRDSQSQPQGSTAAVCVYPQFVSQVKRELNVTNTQVATVVNFPAGQSSIDTVMDECAKAIQDGADEIDCVFPYQTYRANPDDPSVKDFLQQLRQCCTNVTLKMILETGAFEDNQTLFRACKQCLKHDVDFLKTSTGKIQNGANLEAAAVLAAAIAKMESPAGVKVSGGIKSLSQAANYYRLVSHYFKKNFLTADQFRIGASSLDCALY